MHIHCLRPYRTESFHLTAASPNPHIPYVATANLPSESCCSFAASSRANAFFSFFRCFFRWLFVNPSASAPTASCDSIVPSSSGIVGEGGDNGGESAGAEVAGFDVDGMANGLVYFCAEALYEPLTEASRFVSWPSLTGTTFVVKPEPSSFCLPLDLLLLGLLNASNPVFAFLAIDLVRDSSPDSSSSDGAASWVDESLDLFAEPLWSFRFSRAA